MKNIIISFLFAVGFLSATFAQTDLRTRETQIADIVMQLPASNTETFNKLMGELYRLGDVIADLTPKLADPGGNDAQIRYAISGLTMYASKDVNMKQPVAKSLSGAISKAKSDEIRDFLFIQLQYVAGNESVETAAQYLDNPRLADAAARVLVRIGNDAAGKALLTALDKTRFIVPKGATMESVSTNKFTGEKRIESVEASSPTPFITESHPLQITYVQALGDMLYQPASKAIGAFIVTGDMKLRKAMLYSLAQIAAPSSERILAQTAEAAGYKYEPTDALGSYVLYLKNNLPAQASMVTKAASKMLKATSENTQIAAKSAALELLTLSAGEKAISNITGALKSNNKQYRQAALKFSANIKSANMQNTLIKTAQKEKRMEVKAEIIASLSERGDKPAWSFVQECLADYNGNVRTAAIILAGQLAGTDAVAPIVKAMNTGDEQVVAAGKNTLLTIAGNQVITEVAAAIPQTSAQAKVAFIEILASRRATSQAGTIFSQTSSTDAAVRLAACKALASVAEEKDIPRIAQLLNAATNKDEIAALQKALFTAVSAQDQDKQTDLVVEQALSSRNPGVYVNVLAMIGGNKALDLVMKESFNSENTEFLDVAFEGLLNWSDDLAIPQLYKIAAKDPSGTYFDKALSAYITKTGASRNTAEQKLLMLRNALDITKTTAQKQTILRQIARTGTFLGIITAGKYLDDNNKEVQQAAVQAIRSIALAHPEYYGPEITALLNKAMTVNQDPEADYQKQAIMKHLAELPTDEGFVSMFNGKDLTGWKGLVENPIARAKMTPKQLSENQAKADEMMRKNWKVINGMLVYEGKGYDNLCSAKNYADFEMYVDWRITEKGDAGIYLRGSPQVQIWDTSNRGASVGSGGLFNNQRHPANPLVVADNPVNEWNSFYIKMIGEKVIVYFNGQLVVDNITLENYWDRKLPIFEKDAIELQAHGDRVEYRNLFVREIPRPEPYRVSVAEKIEGFVPIFNGIDMSGWVGNLKGYFPQDGAIVCDPARSTGGVGNLYTDKEYANFILRFDFMLTPAANNGIGIRTPLTGDAAYLGMEIQVLDSEAEVYRDLNAYQYHGSVYGVIPAKRGFLKPLGEWNTQEIIADGNRIKVTLNGTVILDGDIAEASKNFTQTIDGLNHPGLSNKSGHIGFLGHGSWVAFRNLRIKELK